MGTKAISERGRLGENRGVWLRRDQRHRRGPAN